MSNRALEQIEFVIQQGDQKHTFSLIPLKKKTAVNIFHNILLTVIDTVSGAMREDASEDEVVEAMVRGLKGLDFDSFWFIAERVMKFAVVDGKESKLLEDADWWPSNPLLLYRAVYEGVKGNYPEVFLSLGLDDFFRGQDPEKKETPLGDTPDQKSSTD